MTKESYPQTDSPYQRTLGVLRRRQQRVEKQSVYEKIGVFISRKRNTASIVETSNSKVIVAELANGKHHERIIFLYDYTGQRLDMFERERSLQKSDGSSAIISRTITQRDFTTGEFKVKRLVRATPEEVLLFNSKLGYAPEKGLEMSQEKRKKVQQTPTLAQA